MDVNVKVLLTDTAAAEVSGPPLSAPTRLRPVDASLSVGGGAEPADRERELAETFGSAPWLWAEADTVRFRAADRRLRSLFLRLPDLPSPDPLLCEQWTVAPVATGGLVADRAEDFALPAAAYRWTDPAGRHLVCLGADPRTRADAQRIAVRIADGTHLLLSDGLVTGWMVTDPARYLADGWEEPPATPPDATTALLLRDCLALTEGPAYDLLDSGDEASCARLRDLDRRVRAHTAADPARMSVLGKAVERLLEDVC
ncbi:hypothetical protein [Actinacidiphila paucisporea]|uniref:Uncharacterized protein n=1 Tax=Actinacidiphila paucisporea TaxID=310782 RepID=A0A1M7BR38_9ACTN|nr:hypothetical protein [Actinacidiphila paucisporea]SHL57336.1 hypothetical protein SAMN05216499_1055 [Actinacidiphila paucisporea]